MNTHIFSIIAGCGRVGFEMLKSYRKYHEEPIHVYCFTYDIADFDSDIGLNTIIHLLPSSLKNDFLYGHQGTAKVWAQVIRDNRDKYLIHIDSDIIFKRESISLIHNAGYPDIYGSRRCYQNNPGKAPVKTGLEDAISTYFLGFNPSFLGSLPVDKVLFHNFERMIQGVYNPLGFPVLDFFDPCFFYMRSQGASVFYEDQNIIGGQNMHGKKDSVFKSNLHMDMGSHLCHFGGVGSGYFATQNKLKIDNGELKMETGYRDWAIDRWNLFYDLIIDKGMVRYPNTNTKYDEAGRWVSGPYDMAIYNQIKEELNQ